MIWKGGKKGVNKTPNAICKRVVRFARISRKHVKHNPSNRLQSVEGKANIKTRRGNYDLGGKPNAIFKMAPFCKGY
jgi:hypothetical protein